MNFLIHLSGVNLKAKMLPMIECNCSSNSSHCKLSDWYSYPSMSCFENTPIYYIYGSWNIFLSVQHICVYTHTHIHAHIHTHLFRAMGGVFTPIYNGE